MVPFGRRSRADTNRLIPEADGRFFILSGFNELLQPAVRISISNPLFNVIFWRP